MKAVIMAGGEGSRLRPMTCEKPKPLVPVCNRPVMAYTLDLLAKHGVQEVFVTLGYRPEAISSLFGDCYRGMRLHYVMEEHPLGTAGGVAVLRPSLTETFLVLSGDVLTDCDLGEVIGFHRRSRALVTLAAARVENPLEYGVVMADRAGRVRRFLEKPGWGEVFSDLVNTGIYVLEPHALDGVPAGRMYDFSRNLFPSLLQLDAPLYAADLKGYWCDIGDPGAYLQANMDMLQGRLRFSPQGREVAAGIWVNGQIPHGLHVDGPALIGEGCRLSDGIRLEGGVVLGPGTVLGREAVVRRTVTWTGASIGSQATVVGAVLCEGSVLEAGAGVFDGAVVGARVSVGEGAAVSPGVRLWPGTEVDPGARVDCTLPHPSFWPGRLLYRGGLIGRPGAELLPESALRVGAAFASVLERQGKVAIGSDLGPSPMLLKQALLCGVLLSGRDVLDVGNTASPVTAHTVGAQGCAGGIHVRAQDGEARVVFYDGGGRLAAAPLRRKLERACERQEFYRAPLERAGSAAHDPNAEPRYLAYLMAQVDAHAIQCAGISVELTGGAWPVLHRWLERLNCRVVDQAGDLQLDLNPLEGTWQVAGTSPAEMMALDFWLRVNGPEPLGQEVPLPVTAPRCVEGYIRQAGSKPVRVRRDDWHPSDPLLSIGRLLDVMAREGTTGGELLTRLPRIRVTSRAVPCPWEAKGRVMRQLLEENAGVPADLIDGLRLERESGWTLLLPDPDEPVYWVYAEAEDPLEAERMADHYAGRVLALSAHQHPGDTAAGAG